MNEQEVKKGLISYELKQAIGTVLAILAAVASYFVGSKFGIEFGAGSLVVAVIAIFIWYVKK